jgi:hypothetical protein
MNKPAVSQAKMLRMKAAIDKLALPFAGFMTRPDGSVVALVGDPLTAQPEPAPDPAGDDDGGWEAHEKRHGYG